MSSQEGFWIWRNEVRRHSQIDTIYDQKAIRIRQNINVIELVVCFFRLQQFVAKVTCESKLPIYKGSKNQSFFTNRKSKMHISIEL